MSILVTGGCGFIGSHTCVELRNAGYDFVIIDNLSNSRKESLDRMETILASAVKFEFCDLLDKAQLEKIFQKYNFNHVIHFAGLKAVGESTQKPLEYYQNNIVGTLNLLETMRNHGVFNIVFSSSATVYGEPKYLPIDEKHPVGNCTNPYGKTKYFIEEMLRDLSASDKRWNIILLRYFNPVGAHSSGLIGEDPLAIPNNLMPYVSQVAVGKLDKLKVFGNDYPTPDGTGVRDYIHVVDLAKAHVASLRKIEKKNCGLRTYNLGTGNGYSVLEMVAAFEEASGRKVAYEIVGRRPGDTASCYCDNKLAEQELGWKAELGIKDMCEDSWRFQSKNPNGFATASEPAKSG